MPLAGVIASENRFPSVLFAETDDASIDTPDAGQARLFLDTDGLFKWKDEAGTVTAIGGDASAHIADTSDAHDASAISFSPTGTIAATDVQAAIAELGTEDAAVHIADATAAHAASAIGFTPNGSIAATDVQAAIQEVRDEASAGAGALVLLETRAASASASLDFTTCISATYDEYVFLATNIVPATDNVTLRLTVSTDGGSSYAATTYAYAVNEKAADSASGSIANSASTTSILLAGGRIGIGTGTGKGVTLRLELSDPLNASLYKSLRWWGAFIRTGSAILIMPDGQGQWQTATAVNAVRFAFSSGNIASGTIRAYGVTK